MKAVSGIYRIYCTKNGRFYYGSSTNVVERWSQHKRLLRKNKHHNPYLQNIWNKYGEDNVKCELVEEVPYPENLHEIENKYLKQYVGTSNCVNINNDAVRGIWNGVGEVKDSIITKLSSSAAENEIPFSITTTYANNLLQSSDHKCFYSDTPISLADNSAKLVYRNEINGYTEGNVVWVHADAAKIKSGYKTENEFIKLCCNVANKYKQDQEATYGKDKNNGQKDQDK
jgi:group I intron endonuclease